MNPESPGDGRVRPERVPPLKGLRFLMDSYPGLTCTPSRAKAARVGDPATRPGLVLFRPPGLGYCHACPDLHHGVYPASSSGPSRAEFLPIGCTLANNNIQPGASERRPPLSNSDAPGGDNLPRRPPPRRRLRGLGGRTFNCDSVSTCCQDFASRCRCILNCATTVRLASLGATPAVARLNWPWRF